MHTILIIIAAIAVLWILGYILVNLGALLLTIWAIKYAIKHGKISKNGNDVEIEINKK